MRINDLRLKTAKPDQTKEKNRLETMMERAGFMKNFDHAIFYTPLGLLLRKTMEEKIVDYLKKHGFVEGHIPLGKTVSSMMKNIEVANNLLVASYKDLPLNLFFREELDFYLESHKSPWKSKTQRVIGFSVLGLNDMEISSLQKEMVSLFFEASTIYENAVFYPHALGEDRFKQKGFSFKSEKVESMAPREELLKVETKGIKTVKQVCQFFSIRPDELLKTIIYSDGVQDYAVVIPGFDEVDVNKMTRILGLEVGRLKRKSEIRIKEDLLISPGFIGPVGIKTTKTLIDGKVVKNKPYVVGANEEDYHLTGALYGRDYTGDFYDITRDPQEDKGWMIGECRPNLPMLRVQSAQGGQQYVPMKVAYLNVDRLVLAYCHQHMDEMGFNFSKDLDWFSVVVTAVDPRQEETLRLLEQVYITFKDSGFKVLHDDRKDRLGSKFNDYDLISVPYRIIIGKNSHGEFDLKNRQGQLVRINLENMISMVRQVMLESELEEQKKMEEPNETL